MAVFRVERNANYTTMSNYHLRDRRLSLKAKGLLSVFLSLPDEWHYSINGLLKITKEGRDSVIAAVRELEKTGYLTRHQERLRCNPVWRWGNGPGYRKTGSLRGNGGNRGRAGCRI